MGNCFGITDESSNLIEPEHIDSRRQSEEESSRDQDAQRPPPAYYDGVPLQESGSGPPPVYHPSPGQPRMASQMSEEEQVKIAQRIGLIQHLPTDMFVEGSKTGDTECVICMLEFQCGDSIRFLPCMHTYHADCIDDWLMRSFTCPSCMEPVDAALLTSYHTSASAFASSDYSMIPDFQSRPRPPIVGTTSANEESPGGHPPTGSGLSPAFSQLASLTTHQSAVVGSSTAVASDIKTGLIGSQEHDSAHSFVSTNRPGNNISNRSSKPSPILQTTRPGSEDQSQSAKLTADDDGVISQSMSLNASARVDTSIKLRASDNGNNGARKPQLPSSSVAGGATSPSPPSTTALAGDRSNSKKRQDSTELDFMDTKSTSGSSGAGGGNLEGGVGQNVGPLFSAERVEEETEQ